MGLALAKCPNCSGENADTQHFCGECGTPLPAAGPRAQVRPDIDETAQLPSAELPSGVVFAKRYQVIEELGTGGMGRVYRVLDKKLDEEIALKLVRPEIASDRTTIERFSAELKLSRQVVHKNVARMFDFNEEGGVPYITMEYVQGENLKRLIRKVGRLFAGQAIPIACQISEGLAEAHRLGIVHRDLKPQNIMIDEDGQAKIMDFGLARLLKSDDRTRKDGTEGTPAYISPEQAKGLAPDGRSDLYSLGVLMYEMLTGDVPFKGASAHEVVQKHLTEPPRDPQALNPGISAGLSQVVMKCLEKDPGARFQTAAEVREALDRLPTPAPLGEPDEANPPRWRVWTKLAVITALLALGGYGVYRLIVAPPINTAPTSTIAVLQAFDVSPGPSGSGFGLELQDSVSTKLTGISDLAVIPSLTVNSVDTVGKNSRMIGRLLRADYLLELSFKFEESALYLKAALIDAKRGRQARTYELTRNAGDLSSVKDEFSRDISMILRGDITEDRLQRTNKGVSSSLDARLLYHEGMRLIEVDFLNERRMESFEEAIGKYRKALALDPDYALALWALGNAYEARYNNTPRGKRDPEDLKLMCEYYYEAYAKNPSSPETNIGLGWAHFNKGEFPKAFEFFKSALKIEPRSAVVNLDAGAFLRSIGLYEHAMRYLSRAASLDPHNPDPRLLISQCLFDMGRFDEAADNSETVVAKDPDNIPGRYLHAVQLVLARRFEKAEKEITAIRGIDPDSKTPRMIEALLAAARGEREKALAFRGEAVVLGLPGTCFYLLLDMKDEAIANIEAGIERGFVTSGEYLYPYPSLAKSPCYRSLRGIPRFQDIVRKQKEEYQKELKSFEDL
jgi:serine/threonine protein kinase/tetratricopeptide (TPR) repeat protein